jgi:uncharacterized membrane protein YgcG
MPHGAGKSDGAHARRPPRLRRRHWAGLITFIVVVVVIAVAVYRSQSGSDLVLPKAFGQDGKCYYIQSPSEVTKLKKAGHCPGSSVPAQAPNSWLFFYYPFYGSRYYTANYVPTDDDAAYQGYLRGFGDEFAAEIGEDAPDATYVTSSGTDETGAQAGVGDDGTSLGSADDSADDGSDGGGGDGGGDDGGDDGGGDDGGGDGGGGDGGD